MKISFFSLVLIQLLSGYLYSQQVIPLYPDSIPNTIPGGKTDTPTLTVYRPAKNSSNGNAVIIFPGGAYSFLDLLLL
jgi:acetyl esterase/lipase